MKIWKDFSVQVWRLGTQVVVNLAAKKRSPILTKAITRAVFQNEKANWHDSKTTLSKNLLFWDAKSSQSLPYVPIPSPHPIAVTSIPTTRSTSSSSKNISENILRSLHNHNPVIIYSSSLFPYPQHPSSHPTPPSSGSPTQRAYRRIGTRSGSSR